MKKLVEKIKTWWYFHLANPVVRTGEAGAFKWKFRRFWLEISTVSGNFKARYMADEHPYAYLIMGKDDNNIIGFCQMVYMVGKTVTSDAGLANDLQKSFGKYKKRMNKAAESALTNDEVQEKVDLAFEQSVQELVEKKK